MPRDISGNYTLPAGNPVVAATIIDINWANPTLNDIAVQLNNVLTLDGVTRPLAPIRFLTGSAAVPSITFFGDTNTGIYAPAADQLAITLGGAQIVNFASTGAITQINQPASAIGVRITSDAGVPFMAFRDRSINAATHTIGAIGFDAYRDISDPSYVAGIRCEGNTPAGNTGDLVFSTGGNAGTGLPPDRLRINYLGAVSIAAPVPSVGQRPLTVNNGDVGQPNTVLDTTSFTVNPVLQFYRGGSTSDGLIGTVGTAGSLLAGTGVGDMVLRTDSGGAVRISTNGGASSTLVVLPGGRVYGTGLHNNGAVSGTTNQYIASGTYTPTITLTFGAAAGSGNKCTWSRLGNEVTVTGSLNVTPGAIFSFQQIGISLPPIPSNIGTANDLNGVVNTNGTDLNLFGDSVNDRAAFSFTSDGIAGSRKVSFIFAYEVLA